MLVLVLVGGGWSLLVEVVIVRKRSTKIFFMTVDVDMTSAKKIERADFLFFLHF